MRQPKSLMLGIGVAAILIGLSGCSTWQRDGDRTAGRVVDDNRITEQVEEGLSREPVFKFSDVDVKTFNGVVQLSGFVNTNDQKERAGQIAQRVDGVAQVVNSIALKPDQLSPTGRTNLPPIETDADRIDRSTDNRTTQP